MPGLGPGKAARWETWSGSRLFLRHPRMDNQILPFGRLISVVSFARHCAHSAFRDLQFWIFQVNLEEL